MVEDKLTFPHSLVLEERKKLTVSGVSDVDNFDEEEIDAYTDIGELIIRGDSLKISHLNTETGELSVEGNISSLSYAGDQPKQSGFLSRLLK